VRGIDREDPQYLCQEAVLVMVEMVQKVREPGQEEFHLLFCHGFDYKLSIVRKEKEAA
jgi:hypothetical protein